MENDIDKPLTMIRLDQLLFGKGALFSKIQTLVDIVERGILDYVAHTHGYSEQGFNIEILLKLAVHGEDASDLPFARLNFEHVR